MGDIFEKIIDIKNIECAYLEVIRQFEETNKIYKYSGFDGESLGQYDIFSKKLLQEIRSQLLEFKPIVPALKREIPKRNKPGMRTVYLHTVTERVKAQSIYRVVEPIFDAYFSRFLFSYRASHPHYRAIKTVVKRYLKNNDECVLVGDISNYSDSINTTILKEQLLHIGLDKKTKKLLELYVDIRFLDHGIATKPTKGIVTGLPITVLFNNLYLDHIDKKIGPSVCLYRRIGDDFIAFDTKDNLNKLNTVMTKMFEDVTLSVDLQKKKIQNMNEKFDFMGYQFDNGKISILQHSVNNIKKYLRNSLIFDTETTLVEKLDSLKTILFSSNSIRIYFIGLVRQYNHCNDRLQIKAISDYFFVRLTIYFFGTYSARNQRKTKGLLKETKIPSIMRYYTAYHTGAVTGFDFKNIQ